MFTARLHPYQDEDVDRMLDAGRMLIAYETGVGKTVVSVAVIEELIGRGDVTTAMAVVLPGLKYQWAIQIAKLTDVPKRIIEVKSDGIVQNIEVPTEDYCVIVDGTPKQRAEQYAKIKATRPDYVILGYTNVVDDWSAVRRIKPECIVLDEVTAIKTFKAQRTRKIKRLSATYRYGLTATPADNGKPEELFSIYQWIESDVLGRFDLYDKTYIVRNKYGAVVRYKNLPVLHKKLAPWLVRRTAEEPEVAPFMPEVIRDQIFVKADAKTKKVYKHIADDLMKMLKAVQHSGQSFDVFAHYHGDSAPNESTEQGKIMARMQALDMLLNHPDLIIQSGMNYEHAKEQKALGVEKKTWPGSKYCYELWQTGLLDDLTGSPKLEELIKQVEIALAQSERNKLIVFSVNPGMLEIINDRLPEGVAVLYHGGMKAGEKAGSVARFTDDPTCRVFLSSHAGSHGTDLFMANYLFNYDHAYASGKQTQIDGRHKRSSSLFTHVMIKDLLVSGSIEVRKFDGRVQKGRVESAMIDGHGADAKGRISNDLMTLTEYLRTASL